MHGSFDLGFILAVVDIVSSLSQGCRQAFKFFDFRSDQSLRVLLIALVFSNLFSVTKGSGESYFECVSGLIDVY